MYELQMIGRDLGVPCNSVRTYTEAEICARNCLTYHYLVLRHDKSYFPHLQFIFAEINKADINRDIFRRRWCFYHDIRKISGQCVRLETSSTGADLFPSTSTESNDSSPLVPGNVALFVAGDQACEI